MATDGRIDKPARVAWPALLRRLCPAPVWQGWLGGLGGRGDARVRWSPRCIVLAWVLMSWAAIPGLRARLEVAWQALAVLFSRRRRPGRSLQTGLVPRLGEAWTWQGWRLFTVDGSRIDAPRTRANERKLGCAGRTKTGPQWWVTLLMHLPSRLPWDWRCGPGGSSERAHLREMLAGLPPGALLLADAGYVGYDLLLALLRAGVDFVIRCGGNTTLRVEGARTIETLGREVLVFLWPIGRGWPLALRLIVLKRRGQALYLLTSVHDTQRLPRRQAAELYALRWGVELNFRALKQTLERRKLLARTPRVGELELHGNLLGLALLLAHGALLLGARLAQASVAGLLRLLRAAVDALRCGGSRRGLRTPATAILRDHYVRRRSKRARDWPHKKHDPPLRPPELRGLTNAQKHTIGLFRAIGVVPYG
jgi:hypothetical protein